MSSDLVVVEQANRHLLNYALLALRGVTATRVAFWGHGYNHQAAASDAHGERAKRLIARSPDWWFCYTPHVAAYLRDLGYDSNRLTVVMNSIDDLALRNDLAAFANEPKRQGQVLYVGGLYPDKRIDFLLRSADMIARRVPSFRLVIVGEGELASHVAAHARSRPWIDYLGYRSGLELAQEYARAQLLLMPGLVGLIAVDSLVAGIPIVTVDDSRHSPEFEYLASGRNAIVLPRYSREYDYAVGVSAAINNPGLISRLANQAQEDSRSHSIESMADRFAEGVLRALSV